MADTNIEKNDNIKPVIAKKQTDPIIAKKQVKPFDPNMYTVKNLLAGEKIPDWFDLEEEPISTNTDKNENVTPKS
jgi:hypothetical protein